MGRGMRGGVAHFMGRCTGDGGGLDFGPSLVDGWQGAGG